MSKRKVTATERQLKSFDWLSIEQWTRDRILNFYIVDGKQNCKICDEWVDVIESDKHVESHKNARIRLKKKEKEEAQERAREMRRLRKEERERDKS